LNCLLLVPTGHAQSVIVAINLLVLLFIALAVGQTIASWSADLVEGRRRIRVFVVAATALYGGINASLPMVGRGADAGVDIVNVAILLAVVAAISIVMTRVSTADLFSAPGDAAPVQPAAPAEQKLVETLMRLMADERIYRQDNITVGTLATRLK